MNAYSITLAPTAAVVSTAGKKHQRLVLFVSLIAIAAMVALLVYGGDYYRLGQADRAFSRSITCCNPAALWGST